MPIANSAETDLLKLLFTNTAFANYGSAGGLQPSSSAGSLFVALHTLSPTEAGDQTTNEATYTGYGRVAVARSGAGWTVSGDNVTNAAAVNFAACTGGTNTIQFWSLGLATSGASECIFYGPLSSVVPEAMTATASSDLVHSPSMAFSVNDNLVFWAREGGSLPGGITEGVVYFVKTAPGAPDYTISTTQGGATLDITSDGSGFVQKVVPLAVSNGITPSFAIGQLSVTIG